MMKRLTRSVSLLVLIVLAMTFSVMAAEKVHLVFTAWGGESHWRVYERLAQAFNEKYEHISIEFIPTPDAYVDKMKTNILAGTGPDIYFSQEMQSVGFIKDGWFLPLNDYIENDPTFDIDQIHSGLFSSFTWEGKIGALPVVTFASMLFYNPVLLAEAGLAEPESLTWDELVEYARALTRRGPDGDVIQYGHRIELWPNFYLYYLWQNEGGVFDEDLRNSILNSQETIEAVEFIHDLIWGLQVVPKPDEMGKFLLENNNVGMFTHGSWMIGYYANLFEFDDFAAISSPVGKRAVNMAYPNAFGISAASKHPDEAWEFLKFASGPEGQRIIAEGDLGIPVNKDPSVGEAYVSGPTAIHNMAALEAVMMAQAPRVVPGMQEVIIDQILGPGLNRVWANEVAPRTALEEAHRLVQAYLDEFYASFGR